MLTLRLVNIEILIDNFTDVYKSLTVTLKLNNFCLFIKTCINETFLSFEGGQFLTGFVKSESDLIPVVFPVSSIVSMLIQATSKARVRRSGISPLHLAAERNRDDVLETLIEAGFDVNAQLSEERSQLYEDRRSTALYFSVFNNNIDAARILLAAGADPNLDMFRPLMVAARRGCIQTITLLVEHGADINASIPTHPTTFPAVYMFSMKYLPMFKYLLDHGGHALSCFDCVYGSEPHPPIKTTRSDRGDVRYTDLPEIQQRRGVQVSLLPCLIAESREKNSAVSQPEGPECLNRFSSTGLDSL